MNQFNTLILLMLFFSTAYGQKTATNKLEDLSIAVKNGAYPNLEGLMITRNGKRIYENYFNGFGKDSLHDTRSAFKSVAGILIGIAIDRGLLKMSTKKYILFFLNIGLMAIGIR
jgi:CubicO group peptidase (beta-lactamase class C family)